MMLRLAENRAILTCLNRGNISVCTAPPPKKQLIIFSLNVNNIFGQGRVEDKLKLPLLLSANKTLFKTQCSFAANLDSIQSRRTYLSLPCHLNWPGTFG